MWTFDRPDGGRSFGFTGGHKHVTGPTTIGAKSSSTPCLDRQSGRSRQSASSRVRRKTWRKPRSQDASAMTAPNLTGQWTCHVETDNGRAIPAFRSFTPARTSSARIRAFSAKRSFSAPSTGATGSVSGSQPAVTTRRLRSRYSGQIESPSEHERNRQARRARPGDLDWKEVKSGRPCECEVHLPTTLPSTQSLSQP